MLEYLQETDPEIAKAISDEWSRQRQTIELIASENYTSRAVLEALGSVMTNKYAEGYPDKRYYGGCEYVDVAEKLAIERAKQLFGADHANVQPHSGTQANMGVYFAACQPGDTMLGMSLSHGGHLSHGHPVNFTGKWYKIVSYGVSQETETIDFQQVRALAQEHKPKVIIVGASAYPRIIDFAKFREIADEVGAVVLADIAHIAGPVAAGLHPSPVPVCQYVTSTTHKTLRGPRGGMILCQAEYAEALDKSVFPGMQGGPLMHVIAAKAVCFKEALSPQFKEYQVQILKNAQAMADEFARLGYRLVSGGTDNHLMLVDLTAKGISGKKAEGALDAANITCNKNMIPFDTRKPWISSGIRIGTPTITTRGMKEVECRQIVRWIDEVLRDPENATLQAEVRERVRELCQTFPFAH
jgi:glycine hydroxymethyltransferase